MAIEDVLNEVKELVGWIVGGEKMKELKDELPQLVSSRTHSAPPEDELAARKRDESPAVVTPLQTSSSMLVRLYLLGFQGKFHIHGYPVQ